MKLLNREFKESDFAKLSENEQLFFVSIEHLYNEITVFEKLLILSTTFNAGSTSGEEHLGVINASESLLISRTLAGKLWEGWELLEKSFLKLTSSTPKYPVSIETDLSTEGRSCLDEIKNYFTGKSVINILRHQFAFHYYPTPGILKKNPAAIKSIDKFESVVTEKEDPFFVSSEKIILHLILDLIDKSDPAKAFHKMISEVQTISRTFRVFCIESWVLLMNRYKIVSTQKKHDLTAYTYNEKLGVPFLFTRYK